MDSDCRCDELGERVDRLREDVGLLKDARRDDQRMFWGFADEHGWHPGVVQVLSDALRETNRKLDEISGFFMGLRRGSARAVVWTLGAVGTIMVAGLTFALQHANSIAKAFSH